MRNTVRICPNCGSTDVGVDRSNIISMMALEQSYQCNNCQYAGIFPEVERDELDENQQQIQDRGKQVFNDFDAEPPAVNTGRFFIGLIFLLIGVPATVYTPWGNGQLAGILAVLIGGGIVFEQFTRYLQ